MKFICMVTQSCYISDSRVRRQAEILSDAGYCVDVIGLYHPERKKIEKFGQVTTHGILKNRSRKGIFEYLGFSFLFFIRVFMKLQVLSLKRKYSVIEIHNMPESLVFVTLLQKLRGAKIVLDIHDLTPELFETKWNNKNSLIISFIKYIEKISCKYADQVLTVTEGCKELLVQRKVPKEKITLILNSPNQDIFKYDTSREFRTITRGANLLYHGTVAERFGLHIAVEAMVHIKKVIPGSIFRIYGTFDEQYKKDLIKQIDSLGLKENILLGGMVTLEEISGLIKNSDIGIVPYISNYYMHLAISTKTLEYAACGLPVVTTRLQTMMSIFDDKSLSYTIPEDPKDIANNVIKLCLDPVLRKTQAMNAYKTLNGISWKVMGKRYLELINSIIGESEPEEEKQKLLSRPTIRKREYKKAL